MKLAAVILAMAHVISVVMIVNLAARNEDLAADNILLSRSVSELTAELRTNKSALNDKFGDAVAKRAKPRKK